LAFGAFLTAYKFALNPILIEFCHLSEYASYALVLGSQIILGFLGNRYFVFDKGSKGLAELSVKYVGLSFFFRCLEWVIYALLIKVLLMPYFYAQFLALGILVIAKYFCFKNLFEAKEKSAEIKPDSSET